MAGFNLGWDDLKAVNPKLVMMSISGFGQEGPERDRASYAPIIHAEMGLLDRQQTVAGADKPIDIAFSIADTYDRHARPDRPARRAPPRAARPASASTSTWR